MAVIKSLRFNTQKALEVLKMNEQEVEKIKKVSPDYSLHRHFHKKIAVPE